MDYRRMGLSGVMVSALGIGGNQFGGRVDRAGTAAILNRALDLGINFIDTADSYSEGASEEMIGKAIGSRRHEFVVATKTGVVSDPPGKLSRRQMFLHLDRSLKRLGTDYLDVYYMHFPDNMTPLEESLRALDDMTRAGKVLYPAISNHPAWQIAEARAICDRFGYAQLVVTQNEYNLLRLAAENELLPACQHFGLSLVPYSPLAEGFLTGKYRRDEPPPKGTRGYENEYFREYWIKERYFQQLHHLDGWAAERSHSSAEAAIAWLLSNPLVCSVITGVTSVKQLEANARAVEWKLSPAQAASIRVAS
jgi:aryl-alcohol dehydrogenase-like predicted oxidoreductase